MAKLLPEPRFRAFDDNGDPLSGGKVYTYEAGTSTPKATYTDSTETTENANPVILDSEGYADIWIDGTYKIVIKDSADAQISSTDNVENISGDQGESGSVQVATAGGTADAITATYDPAITLANLTLVAFVATAANATTTPTFAPNGLTARTITKQGGQALVAGDIPAALAVCFLEYNAANTRWELLNPVYQAGNASGQYKFPATQNASSNANTLDDYEEGTWTPSPTSLTVSGTPTYIGKYTKIGNVVYWSLGITSTTSTTSTYGTTYFEGLSAIGTPVATMPCACVDGSSIIAYASGTLFASTIRVYPPSWTTRANVQLNGFFFV